jgi:hypothetical protein
MSTSLLYHAFGIRGYHSAYRWAGRPRKVGNDPSEARAEYTGCLLGCLGVVREASVSIRAHFRRYRSRFVRDLLLLLRDWFVPGLRVAPRSALGASSSVDQHGFTCRFWKALSFSRSIQNRKKLYLDSKRTASLKSLIIFSFSPLRPQNEARVSKVSTSFGSRRRASL